MHDASVGGSQIDTQSTRFGRQKKHRDAVVAIELVNQALAIVDCG